jgi:GNAT superfamily N-acetyltransferase
VSDRPGAPQRLAGAADAPAVSALMRASILEIFPRFYDERQVTSAAAHIGALDMALIDDRTFLVHEAAGEIVACGGWSRRDRLYTGSGDAEGDARPLDPRSEPARVRAMFVRSDWTRRGLGRAIVDACAAAARAEGFTRLAPMETLPGVPLYRACGFAEVERTMVVTPDGVGLEGVRMERSA